MTEWRAQQIGMDAVERLKEGDRRYLDALEKSAPDTVYRAMYATVQNYDAQRRAQEGEG